LSPWASLWHRTRVEQIKRFFEDQGYKTLYMDGETIPDLILYSKKEPHIVFVEVEQFKHLDLKRERRLLEILRQVKGVLFTYLGKNEKSNTIDLEGALIRVE